jgi:hypothetical protein
VSVGTSLIIILQVKLFTLYLLYSIDAVHEYNTPVEVDTLSNEVIINFLYLLSSKSLLL